MATVKHSWVCLTTALTALSLVSFGSAFCPGALSAENNASSSSLPAIKKGVFALTQALPEKSAPLSLAEWEVIDGKINNLLDPVKNPDELANIAIWCEFIRDGEAPATSDRKFIFLHTRDACVADIARLRSPASKPALQKVARNIYIPKGNASLINNAAKQLGYFQLQNECRTDWVFRSPKSISKLPLDEKTIEFRKALIENFWRSWEAQWPHRRSNTARVVVQLHIGKNAAIQAMAVDSMEHAPKTPWATEANVTSCVKKAINQWKIPPLPNGVRLIDMGIVLSL